MGDRASRRASEMDLRLDDPDPRIRDLAYLLFLEELLGGKRVKRWARDDR